MRGRVVSRFGSTAGGRHFCQALTTGASGSSDRSCFGRESHRRCTCTIAVPIKMLMFARSDHGNSAPLGSDDHARVAPTALSYRSRRRFTRPPSTDRSSSNNAPSRQSVNREDTSCTASSGQSHVAKASYVAMASAGQSDSAPCTSSQHHRDTASRISILPRAVLNVGPRAESVKAILPRRRRDRTGFLNHAPQRPFVRQVQRLRRPRRVRGFQQGERRNPGRVAVSGSGRRIFH